MKAIGQTDRKCCGGHSGTRKPYQKPKNCNCDNQYKQEYKDYKAKCEKKYKKLLQDQVDKIREDFNKRKGLLKGVFKIEHDVRMREIET